MHTLKFRKFLTKHFLTSRYEYATWASWCHRLATCHIFCTYNFEKFNILRILVIVCPYHCQAVLELTLFWHGDSERNWGHKSLTVAHSWLYEIFVISVHKMNGKLCRRWHHQLAHLQKVFIPTGQWHMFLDQIVTKLCKVSYTNTYFSSKVFNMYLFTNLLTLSYEITVRDTWVRISPLKTNVSTLCEAPRLKKLLKFDICVEWRTFSMDQ